MAKHADPINHDGLSSAATVGSKAAWYAGGAAVGGGILGAIGGALTGIVTGASAFIAGSWIGGLPVMGVSTGIGAAVGLVIGGVMSLFSSAPLIGLLLGAAAPTLVVGAAGAIAGAFTFGAAGATGGATYGAVGGGILGVLKGADKVSRESNAFRQRVTEKLNNRENKETKLFNDGEVKGIDEGYSMAMQDMKPQLEAAHQRGMQDGAQMVAQQIQNQMAMAAKTQQEQPPQAEPGKKLADQFECKAACRAEAVIKERQDAAERPTQLGA